MPFGISHHRPSAATASRLGDADRHRRVYVGGEPDVVQPSDGFLVGLRVPTQSAAASADIVPWSPETLQPLMPPVPTNLYGARDGSARSGGVLGASALIVVPVAVFVTGPVAK
jgi:hypothetical protein